MVVGAVDINGQPAVKLNGMDGFRNQELLGSLATEPGSNYGSTVDIWAPGNAIYSTWAVWDLTTNPAINQSGNVTYNNYGHLSGTSMAAPHVAGVAVRLAEIGNLSTPAQIKASVRNYAYYSGAIDRAGLELKMATVGGTHYTAQPTVEFNINGTVNGNLSATSATPFTLSYDSVGAQSCDLTGYLNNAVWYQALNYSTQYGWGTIMLLPGSYRWTVNCRSAQGTMNSAQASMVVTAPTANFSFNYQVQANPTWSGSYAWPITFIKETPYGTPFNFSYNSANTTGCNLNTYSSSTLGGFWVAWYNAPGMPTYYSWPPVSLPRNYYWWHLTCNGAGGNTQADFFAHVY